MPELDWEGFRALPGEATRNFENLCRATAFHSYFRYGRFAALAQQPGVEFHLKIDLTDCPLGNPGRWFGWQTKWWDLAAGRPIGANRRADIVDSIKTTKEHEPDITDWVLWTRRPLRSSDQTWFYNLESASEMRLHLWTEDNLDELLIGDAELLRQAYFGNLVLTPDRLAAQHRLAAAEVGERWMPEVNQDSAAEQRLRRILADGEWWQVLGVVASEIERFALAVEEAMTPLDETLASEVAAIIGACRGIAAVLEVAYQELRDGGAVTALTSLAGATVPPAPPANPVALRRLRGLQHPAALPLTNLLAHTRDAVHLPEDVENHLTTSLAVVTGDAGFGKTQLAATLSAPTQARPAGVLLYGRRVTQNDTLNDLARQMTIGGQPVTAFEELLAAVDAAATRARCRLPIVIDGLNEAEVVTIWIPLLRSLLVLLEKYPSVLVVCTVRQDFVEHAVPDEIDEILTLSGFEDIDEAIDRYFAHYKIDPGDAELPRELFNRPLSLKIYCGVANPDREQPVGIERLPESLTGMFDEYLRVAGHRIYDLNSNIHPLDVLQGLDALGEELWTTRARHVSQQRAHELFKDNSGWQNSLLAALEYEVVVLRQPGATGGMDVSLVYDLLAGHVIAASLLRKHGAAISELLSKDSTTTLFIGDVDERHPLAADIFDALAGLMPRVSGQQLWPVVQEPLRLPALRRAAGLEADYLDAATVDAIAESVDQLRGRRFDIFDRFFVTRAAPRHPLNARFLDRILSGRTVANRDLRWTEWLRANSRLLREDAGALRSGWQATPDRSDADQLRARWLMWTLTSTDRGLRDAASSALYWFGRHDIEKMFSLALEAIAINDPYVGERVLAAAYGVVTAKQLHDPAFGPPLATYLRGLGDAFIGSSATNPTFHALIRHYVSGTFEFARRFYQDAVPAGPAVPLNFAAGPPVEALRDGDPRREEADKTMGMDFGNYTLGRLFSDRRNYDNNHPGHRDATDHVLGVVHALGWRSDLFTEVDRSIVEVRRDREPGRLERYGKKYGWIGFYIVAGMLAEQGLQADHPEVDIDPTFPQIPPTAPMQLPTWARPTPANSRRWLREGLVPIPGDFLARTHLENDHGPWILAHAEINVKDTETRRNTFGLFNTVLVDAADLAALLEVFQAQGHPGRDLIELPGEYYLFAGEIPWHHSFALPEPGGTVESIYREPPWSRRPELNIETLVHSFNWESYHSNENRAVGYVPSKLFSEAFDLRSIPASFDQVEPSGAPAARCFSAPSGFEGELLYLRADLVQSYAADRAIVTFGWGERQLHLDWHRRLPVSLQRLYQAYENVWRTVKLH
ncbi:MULTISPECIES: hypothetical protein [Mycobacterium]|uniref:hypothetical protein n=1 Tax=Mycobacterium TaxID=1763 RepID=UPI00044AA443|nr:MULTISPECIES: hypothetical protein [Mycobacterium]EUA27791.1 hypothetical protein I548_5900 [Mycobacterium intracellulare]UQB90482.1 hypothetical protein KN252_14340 [Mycobacterium intracellulare]WSE44267.1 hypothetical protein QGN30_13590 [Mycobacterium sp. 3-98]